MRVLLDTHVFLWAIADDPRLSDPAQRLFTNSRTELMLSVVSVWEILVKVQLGKLAIPSLAKPFLDQEITKNDITILPLMLAHTFALEKLPMHHRDPFDRLLVAQSLHEDIPLVSGDQQVKAYPIKIIW